MPFTYQISVRATRGGVGIVDTAFTKTDASEQSWDAVQAPTLTDVPINLGVVNRTKIKAVVIVFDQDTTLKTNSTSAPQESFAFKANVALVWTSDMPEACPFVADLSEIYLTTGATATNYKIFFLLSI